MLKMASSLFAAKSASRPQYNFLHLYDSISRDIRAFIVKYLMDSWPKCSLLLSIPHTNVLIAPFQQICFADYSSWSGGQKHSPHKRSCCQNWRLWPIQANGQENLL